MRLLLIFLLFAHLTFSQDTIHRPFQTKILAYTSLGFKIQKESDDIVLEAYNVKIADSGSYFLCDGSVNDSAFVILGKVTDTDTINRTRYDFQFMLLPDPIITWDREWNRKELILHRDSLDSLKQFYVEFPGYYERKPRFRVGKVTFSWKGLKGPPPSYSGGTTIPDSIFNRIVSDKDTLLLSMTSTIIGEDGIARQIGGSVRVIILDGEAYNRAIDPLYDFHHFSDTTKITLGEFQSDDTLKLEITHGHLFIWMPQFKEHYFVSFEDVNPGAVSYSYDPPPTIIPAGNDYYLYDAFTKEGYYILEIYDSNQKRIRKKPIFFNVIAAR